MALEDSFSPSFKTKKKIFQTLLSLSEKQDYATVGVVELCKEAGIARSTFYHHFYSKEDVLAWHTKLLYGLGLDRIGRDLDVYTGHRITSQELYPYRKLYAGSASSLQSLAGPRPVFIRHRIETLSETVTQYHHLELTPRLQFQIEALATAEAHMSKHWFQGDLPINSIDEYCSAIVSIVPSELFEIINKPVMEQSTEMLFASLGI